MSIFSELESQYNNIDIEYSTIEFEATSKGWFKKEAAYRRKRDLNDQAYFLFMFSRLEDRIRQESSKLIIKKQSSISSWKQRSVWDMLPTAANDDKMHFKKRLGLLAEKGHRDYNLVVDYYNERNSIAHGGNFISSISMPRVISQFKRLYNVLKA